ncbi:MULTISPECIES: hypothetical protein [Kocuria]|mgnify:CR=1 FL=1|nr:MULTISPECIES: hypothetical protein [Kocuria]MCT1368300.1 hypothetical protein [Rothia sp. p3-SID1597]
MTQRRKSSWTDEEVHAVMRQIQRRLLIATGIAILVGLVVIGLVAVLH